MNSRNGLVIALLVSAALNLLIIGAVLGRWSRQEPAHPPPMTWTTQALAPEVQQQVRRRLQDRATEVRERRRDMAEASAAVRRAATAEPYDAPALKDALAGLRRAEDRYQATLHDSVAEIAAGLPREQRLALLRQALDRNRGRGRKESPKDRPRER